ncbi:unnamed protein product [Pseudo-nitzschia multistriata]|uniref:Uncharacterized protein n=1 Tax=Pseudo-nitzschia multistriata TaxID=183589 RepID=A0A448Z2H0_9STRA|nr:unnamed protein product [Pseudo-nitzschia multistriata]
MALSTTRYKNHIKSFFWTSITRIAVPGGYNHCLSQPKSRLPVTSALGMYHTTTGCYSNSDKRLPTSWSELIASQSGNGEVGGGDNKSYERPFWSDEWKRLGLGAALIESDGNFPQNLFFVQLGFGVDQHGDRLRDGFATKAAVRAVRNAIEFNSIPGVIDHVPGGRKGMIIHVKLGVPPPVDRPNNVAASIDALEVAKVFPYGKLLPIEIVTGGLEFHSGRVVEELGDDDDVGVCCVACVSIGYNDDNSSSCRYESGNENETVHKTYNTKDGY